MPTATSNSTSERRASVRIFTVVRLSIACLGLTGCASPEWMRGGDLLGDANKEPSANPVVSRVYPNATSHAPKDRRPVGHDVEASTPEVPTSTREHSQSVKETIASPPALPAMPLRLDDAAIAKTSEQHRPASTLPTATQVANVIAPALVPSISLPELPDTTPTPTSSTGIVSKGEVVKASFTDAEATKQTVEPNKAPEVSPAVEVKSPDPEPSLGSETKRILEVADHPAYQSGDWKKSRDALIAGLQEEIRLAKGDPSRTEEAAQLETWLRLQHAIAGKREDAAKAIDGIKSAEQEFWKHYAFGLVDLAGPDRIPSEGRRFAIAIDSLEQAQAHLAAASTLTLKNMALCRKVQDFGRIDRFDRADFARNQEVLLYVELRNFAAEKKDEHHFETELQGSYRVLDRTGIAKAERTLPLDKQTCANLRRDYYIAYRLYIPGELPPGAYTLELTIEDRKAGKSNNGLIDFNVTR